jgi:3-oxoacid CoA-transferase subunit B
VNRIITDLGVLDVTDDGLLLTETAPGVTVEDILAKTDAKLTVAEDLQ